MDQPEIIPALSTLIGSQYVLADGLQKMDYSRDCSSGKEYDYLCLVKPGSALEVSAILKYCNRHQIGVVPRSGGSGVSGGAIPAANSIVLSLERLDRIIRIDEMDRLIVTEAGVHTQRLREEVRKYGLCFPQNISSDSISMIGGNIAVSAGSPKSFKYGPLKNYVLNLEVVLANGDIIWTGRNVRKNASGYNLTQLFAGTEGTLGIITKAVLQLVPLKQETLFLVPFRSEQKLFGLLRALLVSGMDISSLEFLDKNGCRLVSDYVGKESLAGPACEGLLWIELESGSGEEHLRDISLLHELTAGYTEEEVLVGRTASEIDRLWALRKSAGAAAVHHGAFLDLDPVVPCSAAEELYRSIAEICTALELHYMVVGHIGDGNFHVNIFRGDLDDEAWQRCCTECSRLIFEKAIALGGDVSGEHGIGRQNRRMYAALHDPVQLEWMKAVKQLFDPKHILNAGNIFE